MPLTKKKLAIYTTGYIGQKPEALREIAKRLDARVLDIRLSPNSRAPQWRKPSLEVLLRKRYLHVRELGNLNYKGGDVRLADLSTGLDIVNDQLTAGFSAAILLCSCSSYDDCHRGDVATVLLDQGREVIEIMDWAEYLQELKEGHRHLFTN